MRRGLGDFEQRFAAFLVAGIAAVLTRLEFAVGQELAGRQAQGVDPEKQAMEFAFPFLCGRMRISSV